MISAIQNCSKFENRTWFGKIVHSSGPAQSVTSLNDQGHTFLEDLNVGGKSLTFFGQTSNSNSQPYFIFLYRFYIFAKRLRHDLDLSPLFSVTSSSSLVLNIYPRMSNCKKTRKNEAAAIQPSTSSEINVDMQQHPKVERITLIGLPAVYYLGN